MIQPDKIDHYKHKKILEEDFKEAFKDYKNQDRAYDTNYITHKLYAISSQQNLRQFMSAYQMPEMKKQLRKSNHFQHMTQQKDVVRQNLKTRRNNLSEIAVPDPLKDMVRTKYVEDFVIIGQDQKNESLRFLMKIQPQILMGGMDINKEKICK